MVEVDADPDEPLVVIGGVWSARLFDTAGPPFPSLSSRVPEVSVVVAAHGADSDSFSTRSGAFFVVSATDGLKGGGDAGAVTCVDSESAVSRLFEVST